MNGNRFLLDTNVLLYLTGGKLGIAALPEGDFSISFYSNVYPKYSQNHTRFIPAPLPLSVHPDRIQGE